MLMPVLLTGGACLGCFAVSGYFALRWAWRSGYRNGVADMQLTLEDSLRRQFGKENGRG